MLFGIFIFVAIAMIYFYSLYVRIVHGRNALDEALSGIDVQLERRYEILDNCLTIAKKFMKHEKELIEDITKLRTSALTMAVGTKERFKNESRLETKMHQFLLSAENYPTLKSNETMVQAIAAYQDAEDSVAAARRFYNTALRRLNDLIRVFPGTLFSSCAGDLSQLDYFEADAKHRAAPKAKGYF